MRKITYEYFDCFEDEYMKSSLEIFDSEADFIASLKPEMLRDWMRDNSIGRMSSLGSNKFIPRFEYEGLSLSLQINYQLWSMRYDEREYPYSSQLTDNDYYYAPITEDEFNRVLPDLFTYIDVMVEYNGKRIIAPTQMTLTQVVSSLQSMLHKDYE